MKGYVKEGTKEVTSKKRLYQAIRDYIKEVGTYEGRKPYVKDERKKRATCRKEGLYEGSKKRKGYK